MIRDHVWRPSHPSGELRDRLRCNYLGTCGRLRAEHERSVPAARLRQS